MIFLFFIIKVYDFLKTQLLKFLGADSCTCHSLDGLCLSLATSFAKSYSMFLGQYHPFYKTSIVPLIFTKYACRILRCLSSIR